MCHDHFERASWHASEPAEAETDDEPDEMPSFRSDEDPAEELAVLTDGGDED